jgi:hypothetical protein
MEAGESVLASEVYDQDNHRLNVELDLQSLFGLHVT